MNKVLINNQIKERYEKIGISKDQGITQQTQP